MHISDQTTIVVRFFGNGYGTCSFFVRYSAPKKKKKGLCQVVIFLIGCYIL